MAITIHCQCSREIKVSEALAGQPTRCPSCGRRHIVPQREVPPPTPVQQCCRECQTPLHAHANFCHGCGLPTTEPVPGVAYGPPQVPHKPASWPPAPAAYPPPPPSHYEAPQPPQAHAAPPRPQPPMSDPFGANQPFHQPSPHAAAAPPPQRPTPPQQAHSDQARGDQARGDEDPMDGPFTRAARKRRTKPASPLGNVALACAYMGLLLGLVSIAFAVPLSHALGCGGGEISVEQAESLLNLQKGILALIGIFAVFGMLMGFLGMFHFGHKKSGAIWGLVLCFLIGAMASGATERVNERIGALSVFEKQEQVEDQPGWFNSNRGCPLMKGCPTFDDDVDDSDDAQDDNEDM